MKGENFHFFKREEGGEIRKGEGERGGTKGWSSLIKGLLLTRYHSNDRKRKKYSLSDFKGRGRKTVCASLGWGKKGKVGLLMGRRKKPDHFVSSKNQRSLGGRGTGTNLSVGRGESHLQVQGRRGSRCNWRWDYF